jgi:hypothetical protein
VMGVGRYLKEKCPSVKLHPLEQINTLFEAAKAHQLTERAIMVPDL